MIASEFILDASVTVPWVFRDEKCAVADRAWNALVDGPAVAHVPGIWAMEVVNVPLLGPKRSDRPKPAKADVDMFFTILRKLPVRVHYQSLELFLDQAVPLMRRYTKLTCYDAAYVLLAKGKRLPLVTNDALMAKVAASEGVEVIA